MNLINSLKKYLFLIVAYIFIFELIFQIFFFFNLKFLTKADLYYNGYCDQRYWNLSPNIIDFKNNTLNHSKLSFIKEGIIIPKEIIDKPKLKKSEFIKDELSLYGSSYMNHNEFKKIINEHNNINTQNYALESYGLDQIYLSYKLTAHLNQNRTIVLGFLLEDLDRSLFYKREYQKAKYNKINNSFIIGNIPVVQKKTNLRKYDLYLYRFIQNFYNLNKNNFDPRMDQCKAKEKKDLFSFFIDDIKKTANIYNQKVIIITFNLSEDFIKEPSWRYNFIKNYIHKSNISHVDSYKILKEKAKNDISKINSFFGTDKHNNKESFEYIVEELFKNYKAM